MKNKILILVAFMFSVSCVSQANDLLPEVGDAIQKYKGQNYVGCMQDTLEITKNDPADALAYYYMAISYVKLGDKEKALEAYQKVIALSSNSTLKEYAQRGELCLNNPEECKPKNSTDLEERLSDEYYKFINSTKNLSKEVSDKLDEIQIEIMKQDINKEVDDKKSEMPTNDEIANAVKTLAKVGVNPFTSQSNAYIQAQQSMLQNPEYMQLQMMLGNNGNNSDDFMSMLPYFMAQGGKNQNMSADTIKNMMMSSMIGNLSTTFDFDNK